ncbi:hypothetical protein [Spartinivicinus poritis]|uniref:Photosystem II protein M n=1 Tax=Spartinivicinus poritis TaxID=2994640 RepID=A0ABT5UGK3_9GAMM|nr:hypothetical protein [Spartinivicinus sp. A2-2]MDE1465513.1 hypothetical protein [Spartinivicinus sp. A2-2]
MKVDFKAELSNNGKYIYLAIILAFIPPEQIANAIELIKVFVN